MTLYNQLKKGQNGDKKAMEDIYSRFYLNIKKWGKKLGYEEGETDITIAFLELIKNINLEKLKRDDKEIQRFIYTFIKNKSIDLMRRNNTRKEDILSIDYDEKASNFESNAFVLSLVNTLPKKQRIVIVEKFIHQHRVKEIAQRLGITKQAVNGLERRGLRNLKKILKDWGKEWKEK